jgi:alkanesulfonate monooxygenase SsuD/methylene tetrahydromethanopterin reductase-like flavin-dependent oxidoreductase (luciferase family)
VLRKLYRLHEGPVIHDGRFYHLKLVPTSEVPEPLRPEIPIYTAGVNERMVEAAGRVADGLCGHPIHTVKFLQEVARPAIARGAGRSGRDPGAVEVVSTVITSIHEDPEVARREAAAQIAFYAAPRSYAPVLDVDGFAEQGARIRECFAARDLEGMVAEVTDEMIDTIAVAGTVDDVRAGLRRFEGVTDHIALYPPSFGLTPERVEEITMSLIEHCATPEPIRR